MTFEWKKVKIWDIKVIFSQNLWVQNQAFWKSEGAAATTAPNLTRALQKLFTSAEIVEKFWFIGIVFKHLQFAIIENTWVGKPRRDLKGFLLYTLFVSTYVRYILVTPTYHVKHQKYEVLKRLISIVYNTWFECIFTF